MKSSGSSMSLSRSSTALPPSQPKARSVTEKLRSNHIDMLEYAERLTGENSKLKGRLHALLKLSGSVDDMTTADLLATGMDGQESSENAEDASSVFESQVKEMREQLDSLQAHVCRLEAENKTLITKASIQKSSADKSPVTTTAAESLPGSDTNEHGSSTSTASNTNELNAKIKDLTQQLVDTELELQDSRGELSAWITKCCNLQDDLNRIKLKAEVDLAALELRISANNEQDSKLLLEMDALREHHEASMQATAASFKREMEKQLDKEAQIIARKDEAISRQREEMTITKGELANIAVREFDLRESLEAARKEIAELQQHLQTAIKSAEYLPCPHCTAAAAEISSPRAEISTPPDCGDDGAGFTFPEYLRLKRENKALKHEIHRLNKLRLGTSNIHMNPTRTKKP